MWAETCQPCKCSLHHHAVSVRLSGCLSRSCFLSKWVHISSTNLSSSLGSHTILVFPGQALWQYGTLLLGVSHEGGVWKKLLHHVLLTLLPSGVINRVSLDHGKLVTLISGVCIHCTALEWGTHYRITYYGHVVTWYYVIDTDIVTMEY